MIEVADANATYYYHFDALGSVIALSDSSGDTVQTYEYSVYGEVAVEDANHTNPYMFAGVRYDIEIGLYYNRARYYNPFAGRFLQTDPIGYGDGMNMYAYCGNNPVMLSDPTGMWTTYKYDWIVMGEDVNNPTWVLMITCWDGERLGEVMYFVNWAEVRWYFRNGGDFNDPEFDMNDFKDWLNETGQPGPPRTRFGKVGYGATGVALIGGLLRGVAKVGTIFYKAGTAMLIGGTFVATYQGAVCISEATGAAKENADPRNKQVKDIAENPWEAMQLCPVCGRYGCTEEFHKKRFFGS